MQANQAAEEGVYEIPDYGYQAVPSATAEVIPPQRKGSRSFLPPLPHTSIQVERAARLAAQADKEEQQEQQ